MVCATSGFNPAEKDLTTELEGLGIPGPECSNLVCRKKIYFERRAIFKKLVKFEMCVKGKTFSFKFTMYSVTRPG
jgi:hypothetical protein